MKRIPKWWRKFKRHMSAQDILMGRKEVIKSSLTGKLCIKAVKKPLRIERESPPNL